MENSHHETGLYKTKQNKNNHEYFAFHHDIGSL